MFLHLNGYLTKKLKLKVTTQSFTSSLSYNIFCDDDIATAAHNYTAPALHGRTKFPLITFPIIMEENLRSYFH